MLHIKRIKIENIRNHEKLIMSFTEKKSHLLIGKNGDGKTSILRSIAVGLCVQPSSTRLLGKISGSLISHGKRTGLIVIDLIDVKNKTKYSIITKISRQGDLEIIAKSFKKNGLSIKSENFPWSKIFVTGYGAVSRTLATQDYSKYSIEDSVDGIFNYASTLQNPELSIRRAFPENSIPESIQTELRRILGLKGNSKIRLKKNGLFLKNGKTEEIEFGALGDGYQSTLTWILDLVHWWILFQQSIHDKSRKKNFQLDNINGIIIIDEIENHLHPEWEKVIISSLEKTFPKIQFIMSTHSPLVISGSDASIYDFHNARGSVTCKKAYGWLTEDVFKEIMGVEEGSRTKEMIKKLENYNNLFLKELERSITTKEKIRLKKLEKEIRENTSTGDISLLINQMKDLKVFLKK